ncbi:MAG TPA: hypothetical protein H9909_03470 [Candidatus Mediterraneibacter norfolkensis]|nr:hypothetical protein [Candidatus Mediterraneibacter norfolkensis]
MKVQELRQMLSGAERSLVEKAFVESYKQLKKYQKEEVDLLIRDILSGESEKSGAKKGKQSFEELETQIEMFLENAKAGNYYAPNRVIPKSQRPKWRFLVKGYIKELEKIAPDSEHYERAAELLRKIYLLLCEACNYYLFSTEDAFRSVGWQQDKLFHLLVSKTFGSGFSKENVAEMTVMACTGGLSREALYYGQQAALISELKTSDVKYMAMETAKKEIQERKEKLSGLGKYDHQRYYLEEEINNFCDLFLMISLSLAETESGVKFYFRNSIEPRKEIILYRALWVADIIGDDEVWKEIYKYGLSKKIKPRDELIRKYQEKINGKDEP